MLQFTFITILLIASAFLPHAAHAKLRTLSSHNLHERDLQGSRRCPVPYVWKRPTYWRKYYRRLTGKVLKKCIFFEGKVPAPGTTCEASKEGFVCLFGDARCNNVVEPETKCQCTNGVWVCNNVCAQPVCPVDMPSGTCDPLVSIRECKYEEHCCGDSCFFTGRCRCDTSLDKPTWMCDHVLPTPCRTKSLEEAGCPCDRPKNGDNCTADFGCGSACCGAKAYTCKCNSDGIYESCQAGFVPKTMMACICDPHEEVYDTCGTSLPQDLANIDCDPGLRCMFEESKDVGALTAVFKELVKSTCTCSSGGKFVCDVSAQAVSAPILKTTICPTLDQMTYNTVHCDAIPLQCSYPSMECTCKAKKNMVCTKATS
jgi:hypothetical protein